MRLSVCVTTFNSQDFIEECLRSATFADEIIVTDHQSQDSTIDIVRKYTKNIYSRKNDPEKIDIQKNFGFDKAKGDWILSIDADERVTVELAREIRSIVDGKDPDDFDNIFAYRMPRKNIIFGKWIEHSIWWPDYQLRLFRRGKGEYKGDNVHKDLVVEGGYIGELSSPLLHENYQSISQYLFKMDSYTKVEAAAIFKSGKKLQMLDSIRMPFQDFLKTFFLQNGYRDGLHGLVLSILQAFYAFLVFAKVWEMQGFKEENPKDFLKLVHNEWARAQKDVSYWFLTAFITRTKNPLKKVGLAVRRKVRS